MYWVLCTVTGKHFRRCCTSKVLWDTVLCSIQWHVHHFIKFCFFPFFFSRPSSSIFLYLFFLSCICFANLNQLAWKCHQVVAGNTTMAWRGFTAWILSHSNTTCSVRWSHHWLYVYTCVCVCVCLHWRVCVLHVSNINVAAANPGHITYDCLSALDCV